MRLIPTYESHVLNVIYVRIILKIRIIRARIIRDVFYLRSLHRSGKAAVLYVDEDFICPSCVEGVARNLRQPRPARNGGRDISNGMSSGNKLHLN